MRATREKGVGERQGETLIDRGQRERMDRVGNCEGEGRGERRERGRREGEIDYMCVLINTVYKPHTDM